MAARKVCMWFGKRCLHSPPESGGVPSRSEGGAVCSKTRSDLMDIREALLIDRCATRISKRMLRVFEQTAPALASRGHPRLTQAGNADTLTAAPILVLDGARCL